MKLSLNDGQLSNTIAVQQLLTFFVASAVLLYGKSFVSLNVNSLIHLYEDYERYGNLENVSAFPFESFLGAQVKGSVRAGYKPLQQMAKHLNRRNLMPTQNLKPPTITSGKVKKCSHGQAGGDCFKKVQSSTMLIRVKTDDNWKDSCIQNRDGDIGLVCGIHKLVEQVTVLLQVFVVKDNFFTTPVPSSTVGVHAVSQLGPCQWIKFEDIFSKMILLPFKKFYIAELLPHSVAGCASFT